MVLVFGHEEGKKIFGTLKSGTLSLLLGFSSKSCFLLESIRQGRKMKTKEPESLEGTVSCSEKGSFGKGVLSESRFSRDSRELRDSRDSREPPDCRKQTRVRPFSRESRESIDFRVSRDSSSEKTPFIMTPFSVPNCLRFQALRVSSVCRRRVA